MQRRLTWVFVFVAVSVVAAGYVGNVFATDASGFSATTIARGRFDDIDVMNHSFPEGFDRPWISIQKAKGPSDLFVQSNVWIVGGTTGWHTHPGHSLIIVTAGTVTVYESDDPDCTPHVYTAGMGFVDRGGDHSHLVRNEGDVEARTVAVQLVPADATRRISVDGPEACPF